MDILLLINKSNYAELNEVLKLEKKFTINLIEKLNERDRLSIISYTDKALRNSRFRIQNEQNKRKLVEFMKKMTGRKSNNLALALQKAMRALNEKKFNNDITCIFLLTDGQAFD